MEMVLLEQINGTDDVGITTLEDYEGLHYEDDMELTDKHEQNGQRMVPEADEKDEMDTTDDLEDYMDEDEELQ